MKYVKIEWPEIQEYMSNPDYNKDCYFDPRNNCWFIPDTWEPDTEEYWGGDIGDLENTLG